MVFVLCNIGLQVVLDVRVAKPTSNNVKINDVRYQNGGRRCCICLILASALESNMYARERLYQQYT